jgi:uncharacterized protein
MKLIMDRQMNKTGIFSPKRTHSSVLFPSVFGFLLLFLFLGASFCRAQNLPSFVPKKPVGYVNDYAHLLNRNQQRRLDMKLRNYRDTTSTVIAIATFKSLHGHAIQPLGTKLFSKWNLWQGHKDNGVLILIAKKEHKIRIEVGYGLEGTITDLKSGEIIRNIIAPAFKKGSYYAGLNKATTTIIKLAQGEYTQNLTKTHRRTHSKGGWGNFIVFFIFIAFVIYATSRRGGGKNGKGGGRRRYHTFGPGGLLLLGGLGGFGLGGGFGGRGMGGGGLGGGGGFGGFGGMGGFGSGGGGAMGGW